MLRAMALNGRLEIRNHPPRPPAVPSETAHTVATSAESIDGGRKSRRQCRGTGHEIPRLPSQAARRLAQGSEGPRTTHPTAGAHRRYRRRTRWVAGGRAKALLRSQRGRSTYNRSLAPRATGDRRGGHSGDRHSSRPAAGGNHLDEAWLARLARTASRSLRLGKRMGIPRCPGPDDGDRASRTRDRNGAERPPGR